MARYEHLPIYKASLDLAVHFEKVVAGFSRYHKYTLGADLRNQSRAVVTQVIQANHSPQKYTELVQLRARLEELLLLTRIGKEVQAFKSFKAFKYIIEKLVSISRQNEGWIKSAAKRECVEVNVPE